MDPKIVPLTGIFLVLLMVDVIRTEGEMLTGPNTTGGRLYHVLKTPKTWSEAQSFCRVNYNDLATVDSMKEHMQLKESIGNADLDNIWIGLERSPTEWWVWSEGIGEVEVYTWNVNKEYGDCVAMKPNGLWYAYNCNNQNAFLCSKYDSQGRESYFLNTMQMSWRDAQSFCRQNYVDLVSVKTTEQNREIYTHGGGLTFWIGLIREDWRWSDRSTGSFRNWGESSPDNVGGVENCTVIRKSSHQWDDSACDHRNPFVCYGEPKIKRTVLKVKIRSDVDLNLPAESDSLLKQFQAQLEEQGVHEVKVRWQSDKNEQIFHRTQDKENGTETTCE